MQHEERRTGARMFVWSGTVGDDPLLFVEVHTINVYFKPVERNGQRLRHMLFAISFRASHIHNDRRASSVRGVGDLERHTRHVGLGER